MTTRSYALDEVGNLDAAPGSREWAIAVRLELQGRLSDERASAAALKGMLDLMSTHGGWKQLEGPKGAFRSFEQFCLTRHPFGLGYDLDAINHIVADREKRDAKQIALEAQPMPERGPGPGRGHKTDSDTTCLDRSAEYLAARLKRDAPEVLDRVASGELPSMRAGALEAGIVKERVSVERSHCGFARAALKHLGVDGCHALIAELQAHLGVTP